MDGDGIPMALDITPSNTNEQVTKPLENKIINDFNTSKFVVCTDAGLASTTNIKYNNTIDKTYNISKLRENDELIKSYYDKTFYKERWIKEDGLEQRLIITFSPKYQEY